MWLDDRTLELIQLAIDGEATQNDRAELDAILASSPEARAMFEAMKNVARQLDAVPMVDPPGVRQVLAAVAEAKKKIEEQDSQVVTTVPQAVAKDPILRRAVQQVEEERIERIRTERERKESLQVEETRRQFFFTCTSGTNVIREECGAGAAR